MIVHIVILLVQCNEGHGLVKYGRPLSCAYVSYDWSRGPSLCRLSLHMFNSDSTCICVITLVEFVPVR